METIRDIKKSITTLSIELGFLKKGVFFIKPLEGKTFTLAFNFIKRSEYVAVEPYAGISIPDVDNLLESLSGQKRKKFQPFFSTQLGYIHSNSYYKVWEFLGNKDSDFKIFEDLEKTLKTNTDKFYKNISNINYLIKVYEDRLFPVLNYNRDRVLPILYYLNGQKKKGIELILESIKNQLKEPSKMEMEEFIKSFGPNEKVIINVGNSGEIDESYLNYLIEYKKLP